MPLAASLYVSEAVAARRAARRTEPCALLPASAAVLPWKAAAPRGIADGRIACGRRQRRRQGGEGR